MSRIFGVFCSKDLNENCFLGFRIMSSMLCDFISLFAEIISSRCVKWVRVVSFVVGLLRIFEVVFWFEDTEEDCG